MRISFFAVTFLTWLLGACRLGDDAQTCDELCGDSDVDSDADTDADTDTDSDSDTGTQTDPATCADFCEALVACEPDVEPEECTWGCECAAALEREDVVTARMRCASGIDACDTAAAEACVEDLDFEPTARATAFVEACAEVRPDCEFPEEVACEASLLQREDVIADLETCLDEPTCDDFEMCRIEVTLCARCDMCPG